MDAKRKSKAGRKPTPTANRESQIKAGVTEVEKGKVEWGAATSNFEGVSDILRTIIVEPCEIAFDNDEDPLLCIKVRIDALVAAREKSA